ncbi:MAG: 4,5-DOPA dioxygenase extradiol [Acidimicrobiaceae bacterium]|nr:4,5-DOPA dioxygenase extradiol [Acidimicrobiaceae bacterium]
MPAAFVGHGSPMNTLEYNRYTDAWSTFANSFEKPAAILAISAHWYINATAVTSMARPRVIHDFYGFAQELFDFDYPVLGDQLLAQHVADLVDPTWVGLDDETWGIDHGTWSILAHMYPDADVPVVQLAIDASKPLEYHIDLGARLAPLRDEGVLILGSGNVVHNLRAIEWRAENQGFEWAQRFDDDTRSVLMSDPSQLGQLTQSDDYRLAVPTPDHFLPLAYLAGLASVGATSPSTFAEGCTMGSLSMTSYAI